MRGSFAAAMAWLAVLAGGAVQAQETGATQGALVVEADAGEMSKASLVRRQLLHAVWGGGLGTATLVPFGDGTAEFSVHIRVVLEGAKPNTVYVIQRAAELGRDAVKDHDGRCQRSFALPPWSASDAPAPSFATFVAVDASGAATPEGPILLRTNRRGHGVASFDFHTVPGVLTSGSEFDVVFRVLDDLANPASLLVGECVTVEVP
jgi:hypothetical protein